MVGIFGVQLYLGYNFMNVNDYTLYRTQSILLQTNITWEYFKIKHFYLHRAQNYSGWIKKLI